jgi:toxin ParE1/3/4
VRPLRLSKAAERDLEGIFASSEAQFGEAVADRYRRLVSAALQDLRDDASRAGVQSLAGSGARLYHLRHGRRRLERGQSIARPRHLLAFRIISGGIVILRVLHDAMDLPQHLKDI